MAKHEALHFAVVATTPIRQSEKGPADLDLVPDGIIGVEARGADDLLGSGLGAINAPPEAKASSKNLWKPVDWWRVLSGCCSQIRGSAATAKSAS